MRRLTGVAGDRCHSCLAPVLALAACEYGVEQRAKQLACGGWEEQRQLPAVGGIQQVSCTRHAQHTRNGASCVGDAEQCAGILGGQVLQQVCSCAGKKAGHGQQDRRSA